MAIITIPKILREKLSEEGAEALVEVINKSDERTKEDVLLFVEEKFERRLEVVNEKYGRRLAEEVGKVRAELSNGCSYSSLDSSGRLSGYSLPFLESKNSA